MKLIISPGNSLKGKIGVELPGDKSISHRAALFAALADGQSQIENFQVSGVTRPMLRALTALGISWHLDENTLTVEGKGLTGLISPAKPIDCGNSATTLRLLAGAIATAGISAELDGSSELRRRPMERIITPLKQMGVKITTFIDETAPLRLNARLQGTFLRPLNYTLPVASAQVKTCLLLAGLGAPGRTILCEPGPSRDHSERMLTSMGVKLMSWEERSTHCVEFVVEMTVSPHQTLSPLQMFVPGDPSATAFLVVAALITPHSQITIQGVCLNPTRTGLFDVLMTMGATITFANQHTVAGEPVGDVTVKSSHLHGTEVSGQMVVRMIDEFPIFAVAAALAEGTSVVHEAAELRLKESDRISVLAGELSALGVEITEQTDGFTIRGGKIRGGEVNAHGDHRLAMTLSVAGLAAESNVTVTGAECIAESFPSFATILQKLGAHLNEVEL